MHSLLSDRLDDGFWCHPSLPTTALLERILRLGNGKSIAFPTRAPAAGRYARSCWSRLAGRVLDVPPTETLGRVRQVFALQHMLDLPGRRAEDVQLLEVPRYGGMRARLVFRPVSHARL
jgi:hypothetical protein